MGNSKIAEKLPNAIANIEEIFESSGSKKPALFLDYDGTLTPIVPNPEDAVIDDRVKEKVNELSGYMTVAVISGRDRNDIKSLIGIDSIIYAGSHGFDITGPENLEMQYEPGRKSLPFLDEAEKNLTKKLAGIEGAMVERKKYAIAVHYRNVAENKVDDVKKVVREELENQDQLKKGSGKKVLELKPNLDWDKGKALNWLMEKLGFDEDNYIPLFIGDDVTDEDALKAIHGKGIGIIVGEHSEKTYATYRLENTDEVIEFLSLLKKRMKEAKN